MVKTVYQAFSDRAAASSITIASVRIFAFEGDSRSIAEAYPSMWVPSPLALGITKALSGSTLANLVAAARLAEITAVPAVKLSGQRYYAVVGPMGANDLGAYPGATDAIAAASYAAVMAGYTDSLYAAGFDRVVLCTELPTGNATHNTRRNLLNVIYTTAYPGSAVTICDMAADPIMGPDTSFATSPSNWTDSTHPNAAGNLILAGVLAPVLNALT